MEVIKEVTTTRDLYHGHTVVTVEPTRLCERFPTRRGLLVRCPGSADPNPNTAPVWIGRSTVTADSSPTGGMPILPGMALVIPVDDPSLLYVVSTDVNQDIAWMGV